MAKDWELIMGLHSIVEALNNNTRNHVRVVGSSDGIKDLLKHAGNRKILEGIKVEEVSSHQVQEISKNSFRELDFEYQRIPSQVFLESSVTEIRSVSEVYDRLIDSELKIFCLDQVTDLYNSAAIMRTAAFYGVDYLVVPSRGSFGISPKFSRIASGALEHVKLVNSSSLSKFLKKLPNLECSVVGFSEHASIEVSEIKVKR